MEEVLNSNHRVAILVDSSNLFITARHKGAKVNYQCLLGRLNGRRIVRSILYHVEADAAKEECFLRKIKSFGFEVRKKKLKTYRNGDRKGDMDVDITIDAVCLADKVDVICLVSGDGDYVPLVHYLKSRGVRVEAMAFKSNTSGALRDAVDAFTPITEDMLIRPEPSPE